MPLAELELRKLYTSFLSEDGTKKSHKNNDSEEKTRLLLANEKPLNAEALNIVVRDNVDSIYVKSFNKNVEKKIETIVSTNCFV